jgi:hypothetical protein
MLLDALAFEHPCLQLLPQVRKSFFVIAWHVQFVRNPFASPRCDRCMLVAFFFAAYFQVAITCVATDLF